ncbi:MAG: hypothetical protein V4690_00310 [Patescibacteria group bacterium]
MTKHNFIILYLRRCEVKRAEVILDNVRLSAEELLSKYRVLSLDQDLAEVACMVVGITPPKREASHQSIHVFMDTLEEMDKKLFLAIYGPLFTERRSEESKRHTFSLFEG